MTCPFNLIPRMQLPNAARAMSHQTVDAYRRRRRCMGGRGRARRAKRRRRPCRRSPYDPPDVFHLVT